jgi:hypothetical protein
VPPCSDADVGCVFEDLESLVQVITHLPESATISPWIVPLPPAQPVS